MCDDVQTIIELNKFNSFEIFIYPKSDVLFSSVIHETE